MIVSLAIQGDDASAVPLISTSFGAIALVLLLVESLRFKRTRRYDFNVNFNHNIVLIVGASSGMGRLLALRLAAEGAYIIATARRQELLDSLANEIIHQGGRCLAFAVNAENSHAAEQLVATIVGQLGRIDVAVLNAGGAPALDMRQMSAQEVTAYMRSNYDVTVNYLFPVLHQMSRQRKGLVVHTNSLAGFLGVPLQGPYSAAKGALRLLIDTCRIEFGDRGIKFVSVYPGFVATAQTANDGMPAPLEISEAAAVEHMLFAMRSQRWDYMFPWSMRWLIRLAMILPKPVTLWVLRRDLPALANDCSASSLVIAFKKTSA